MKKKLVEVSVRKNIGVIMNSFSQFHSTFIRKHSRFFVRVGHKPQSVVYKVCPVEIFFFSLSSSEKYLWIFWKKYFKRLFVKMCQFLSALLMILVGLVILLPCPYSSPKMFCASPNFMSQPKTLTAFSASSKTFVPAQKPILLNANHLFVWHKMFVTATICK